MPAPAVHTRPNKQKQAHRVLTRARTVGLPRGAHLRPARMGRRAAEAAAVPGDARPSRSEARL